jgi:hypothetical protein
MKVSKLKINLVATMISALVIPMCLAADDLAVWAPKMVVIDENTIKNNPIFKESQGEYNKNILGSFNTAFKKYFPDAKTELDKKNVKNTIAAYLKISRASVYDERTTGSSVTTYTLPLTASINFFNMANGDILYSHSFTDIQQGDLAADGEEKTKKLAAWYIKSYGTLFEKLAKEAGEKFKPHRLSTKVIGVHDGLLILGKGLDDGIGKGDALVKNDGGSAEVLFSTNGYAIAQNEFLDYPLKTGDTLIKTYSGSLDGIKKPKVTLLDIQINQSIKELPPEAMLYEVFSDKIAGAGNFSLVSIGKDFYAAKRDITAKAGERVLEGKRSVPEYFLRLSYDGPHNYDLPTNVSYAKQTVYSTQACGELVDLSGRVFHSGCALEEIRDDIVHGKGFTKAARYEVAMKNATLKLAESFATGISFEKIEYKVTKANSAEIEFVDEKNLLASGATVTVYKNIGTVGDKKNVLIPVQEAVIDSKANGIAKATLDSMKIAPKLSISAGDIIVEDVVSAKAPSDAKLFPLCQKPSRMDKLNIDGFDATARFLIKKSFKYPLYDTTGFAKSLKENIDDTKFDKSPSMTTPKTQYCIQPVHWLELKSKQPSEIKGFETQNYDLTAGVRVYDMEELKGKTLKNAVVKSKKSFEVNPNLSVPVGFEASYLHIELLKNAQKNFETAVQGLQVP